MTRASPFAALLMAVMAADANAEVCDKERPGWNPADGPVGPLQELIANVISVPGLSILILAIFAAGSRAVWLRLTLSVISFAFAAIIFWQHQGFGSSTDRITAIARSEGCVGPPGAAIALFILLGATLLARAARVYRGRSIP